MTSREYPSRPLLGVGGVVLDRGRVLLVRRAHDPLKGQWSLPGGLVETGETLAAAVRREIAEETGLRVRVEEIVEVLDYIVRKRSSSGRRPVRFHYVLVDFLCRIAGGRHRRTAEAKLRASSDSSEARWVSRRDLGKYHLRSATLRVIAKAFQRAPKDRDSATGRLPVSLPVWNAAGRKHAHRHPDWRGRNCGCRRS